MTHPPDECTSKEDDSSDSDVNNDDIHINTNVQPETVGKGGVSWSTQRTTTPGRLHTTNIMKKKTRFCYQTTNNNRSIQAFYYKGNFR
jgi:hypothetical protein